jgi:hypothetical protein
MRKFALLSFIAVAALIGSCADATPTNPSAGSNSSANLSRSTDSGPALMLSSNGVINACYMTTNGQLRVIAAGDECRANEVAIALALAGSDACPQGTTRFINVCIETQSRAPRSHTDATRACASEDRRLPSSGELKAFREQIGIVIPTGGEWTDDLGDVTYASSFVYHVVGQNGNGVAVASSAVAYRCVA